MWLFHILINVDLTWWGSCEVHNHNTYQMSPNFLVKSFFVDSLLIPWHHLQENNMWMLLLVHNIQMLWYDWCEIHTLMPQSDWRKIHTLMQKSVRCEIRTLMWWSDWCGHYTTLQANKFFFFFVKKKIIQKCLINDILWENIPHSNPSSLMSLLAKVNASLSPTLYHLSTTERSRTVGTKS